MHRVIALTFASLAFLALAPAVAEACSCLRATPAQARDGADAIFEGRVTLLETHEDHVRVTFAVTQQWKGVDSERLTLTTATNSAACGFPFAEGETYLVYAHAHEGGLETTLCDRTALVTDAGEDLAALGSGSTPVDVGQPTPVTDPSASTPEPAPSRGCASCAAAPPSPAALVAPLALLLLGRRRR
ncbi:MAG: hypothetical protein KF901_03180 [Myxococcales bacterium]|nr:hypothetical protein [Myxococcales bacterium]